MGSFVEKAKILYNDDLFFNFLRDLTDEWIKHVLDFQGLVNKASVFFGKRYDGVHFVRLDKIPFAVILSIDKVIYRYFIKGSGYFFQKI